MDDNISKGVGKKEKMNTKEVFNTILNFKLDKLILVSFQWEGRV